MARIRKADGTVVTDKETIASTLAPLGIQVDQWPIPEDGDARNLLARPALADEEKERVLAALDSYFQTLKSEHGYESRDLIVLHPEVPGLDDLLAKFDRCHTHDDDEVRYIVDGDGTFGFVLPDGEQLELTVEAPEYINVPAGTEHWFVLTEARRIKAVRYFTGTEGWTPHYTGTPIRTA